MSGFSIIIPTFNRAALLATALDSVQQLRVPEGWDTEVLVIDNNSTDQTPEIVARSNERGRLRVRRIVETKQGLNHGRNRGLQEASFDHLVYLDDDMIVGPGWLGAYVETLEALEADCVVGPVQPRFEEPPPAWVTEVTLSSVTSRYSHKGDRAMVLPLAQSHEVPGSNFGVRREAAVEVGGFHPSLDRCGNAMLAGGDFEFGEKLSLFGRRVAYCPNCRIQHFISRQKISVEGLRSRWEGLGATTYALMRLRGETLPPKQRVRMFARMLRFFARSRVYALKGDRGLALEWELQARKIRGLLFKGPRHLSARNLPSNDGVAPAGGAFERRSEQPAAQAKP